MNARFERALARFDEENSRDPNLEQVDLQALPRELVYARRLTEWVLKLEPHASEGLLLAARSQHICRWKIPRSDYPADRVGYHRWKNDLKRFHADLASTILRETGYDEAMVTKVRRLNLKEAFPTDHESRTLEDALCLVFMEYQLAEFAARTDRAKVVNALRKSWAKMTDKARQAALELPLAEYEKGMVTEALAS